MAKTLIGFLIFGGFIALWKFISDRFEPVARLTGL